MLRKLTLGNDTDVESPNEDGHGWRLYSFSTKHASFKHPENFNVRTNPGLRSKFKAGLAHWLSYYEHGNCLWQLTEGRHVPGSDCPWDSVQYAGIVVFEGPAKDFKATPEVRKKSAAEFCRVFTEWSNGECYWFSVEDKDGNDLGGCGGFIGLTEHIAEYINESLADDDRVLPAGELAGMVQYIPGRKG
jgi:hypothetical protein